MKNADLPAMPNDTDAETLSIIHGVNNFNDFLRFRTGLTKREDFTKTFIAACISEGNTYKGFIDDAIMWAEEALAKLDETKS